MIILKDNIMGIPKQVVKLLLEENEYQPIKGEFLSFGKQTVAVKKEELNRLIERYGYSGSRVKDLYDSNQLDFKTRHADSTIEDNNFLSLFADVNYNCMDISDYEGANIIHDLNYPVPKKLHKKFDFIFTGGCLDNVFNPVSLLVNS